MTKYICVFFADLLNGHNDWLRNASKNGSSSTIIANNDCSTLFIIVLYSIKSSYCFVNRVISPLFCTYLSLYMFYNAMHTFQKEVL